MNVVLLQVLLLIAGAWAQDGEIVVENNDADKLVQINRVYGSSYQQSTVHSNNTTAPLLPTHTSLSDWGGPSVPIDIFSGLGHGPPAVQFAGEVWIQQNNTKQSLPALLGTVTSANSTLESDDRIMIHVAILAVRVSCATKGYYTAAITVMNITDGLATKQVTKEYSPGSQDYPEIIISRPLTGVLRVSVKFSTISGGGIDSRAVPTGHTHKKDNVGRPLGKFEKKGRRGMHEDFIDDRTAHKDVINSPWEMKGYGMISEADSTWKSSSKVPINPLGHHIHPVSANVCRDATYHPGSGIGYAINVNMIDDGQYTILAEEMSFNSGQYSINNTRFAISAFIAVVKNSVNDETHLAATLTLIDTKISRVYTKSDTTVHTLSFSLNFPVIGSGGKLSNIFMTMTAVTLDRIMLLISAFNYSKATEPLTSKALELSKG